MRRYQSVVVPHGPVIAWPTIEQPSSTEEPSAWVPMTALLVDGPARTFSGAPPVLAVATGIAEEDPFPGLPHCATTAWFVPVSMSPSVTNPPLVVRYHNVVAPQLPTTDCPCVEHVSSTQLPSGTVRTTAAVVVGADRTFSGAPPVCTRATVMMPFAAAAAGDGTDQAAQAMTPTTIAIARERMSDPGGLEVDVGAAPGGGLHRQGRRVDLAGPRVGS